MCVRACWKPKGMVVLFWLTSILMMLGMQDDAREASWFNVGELPSLAFDHKLVVRETFKTLAGRPEAAGALSSALAEAAFKLDS